MYADEAKSSGAGEGRVEQSVRGGMDSKGEMYAEKGFRERRTGGAPMAILIYEGGSYKR